MSSSKNIIKNTSGLVVLKKKSYDVYYAYPVIKCFYFFKFFWKKYFSLSKTIALN